MCVPRQGVEPCFALDLTPARWGSLAQGRVLGSLSRAAATAVAEKRGEPHGGPRKPLKLYNYNPMKKMCARACSDVNAYMAVQVTANGRASQDLRYRQVSAVVGIRSGFRVPAAKRCITCPGNDFPGYSP